MNIEKFNKQTKYNKITMAAKEKLVEKLIKNIVVDQELVEELAQDIYLILLEKEDKIIDEMSYQKFRNFVIQIAHNQFNSSTSPFYKQQKRHIIFKAQLENFDVNADTGEICPLNIED